MSRAGAVSVDSQAWDGSAERRPPVLFAVHSTHLGGGEILAYQTARWLSRCGHRLTIAAPDGPLHPLLAETGAVAAPTPTLPTWGASARRWAFQLAAPARDVPRMRRLIRDSGSEVVLTNTSTTLAPVIAARLAGVPVVVHVREWPTSRLATPLLRLHTKIATTVVVIAEPLLATAARGRSRARLVHIHDGIQPGRSAGGLPHRLPGRPLQLAVVGWLRPPQGPGHRDPRLGAPARRGNRRRADLVGPGGCPHYMDELASAHRRPRPRGIACASLGERRDVPALMATLGCPAGDPHAAEWTPLAIMEAMAIGLPVMATSVGAVTELLDRGRCGVARARPATPAPRGRRGPGGRPLPGTPAAGRAAAAARERVLERFDLEPSLERLGRRARTGRAVSCALSPEAPGGLGAPPGPPCAAQCVRPEMAGSPASSPTGGRRIRPSAQSGHRCSRSGRRHRPQTGSAQVAGEEAQHRRVAGDQVLGIEDALPDAVRAYSARICSGRAPVVMPHAHGRP